MSLSQDQLAKLRNSSSIESFIMNLKILLLNDRVHFFGRCYRDPAVTVLLQSGSDLALGAKAVLEVLCFGNYNDWISIQKVPQLSKALNELSTAESVSKIKVLTLVSLCAAAVSAGSARISYDEVAVAVGLDKDDVRGVEELVLTSMSTDLVDCRMNQRQRFVEVISAQAREVQLPDEKLLYVAKKAQNDFSFMIEKLSLWHSNCITASKSENYLSSAIGQRTAANMETAHKRATESSTVFNTEVKAARDRKMKETNSDDIGGGMFGGPSRRR